MAKLPVPTEEAEQRVVAEWLELHRVAWFHVPNQRGTRKRFEMGILKALGVKPGVCDIIIVDRPPKKPEAPGTVVEMKRAVGGKLSEHQREWLEIFKERGWETSVCNGADETIRFLEGLGYGRRWYS